MGKHINTSIFKLKTYDSGWFAVASNGIYTKTHSLGTVKLLVVCLAAASADGSGDNYMVAPYYDLRPASDIDGLGLKIASSQITAYLPNAGIDVVPVGYLTGSLRIILLAL